MYDLILRGGTVVDGKRSQPYAADICIREGRIARIAPEGGEEAREVVDVSGLAVAPGFIDIHTHSDACPLVDYEPESKLHGQSGRGPPGAGGPGDLWCSDRQT